MPPRSPGASKRVRRTLRCARGRAGQSVWSKRVRSWSAQPSGEDFLHASGLGAIATLLLEPGGKADADRAFHKRDEPLAGKSRGSCSAAEGLLEHGSRFARQLERWRHTPADRANQRSSLFLTASVSRRIGRTARSFGRPAASFERTTSASAATRSVSSPTGTSRARERRDENV